MLDTTITAGSAVARIAGAGKASPVKSLTIAQAIAQVNTATGNADTASATLASVVLATFKARAQGHTVRILDDDDAVKVILPKDTKSQVLADVWQAATGSRKAPETATRSKGEKLTGEYLSRFARVAMNMAYGLDAMTDYPAVQESIKAIATSEKEHKDSAESRASALAKVALDAWLTGQTQDIRNSFKSVELLMTGTAREHCPAFLAHLNARHALTGE